MQVPGFVLNLFMNKVLKQLLDGDKGSTILTAILTPIIGAQINWPLAFQGFASDQSAVELAKVVGLALAAVWGFFIGHRKQPKV